MPMPENANSVMLLRPTTTAPAARSRVTAAASAVAGAASRRIVDPAVVTSPAISNRSLIETGSPASAACAWTLVNTRPPSPPASAMRESAASISLRLVVLPSASSRASAAIGRMAASPMLHRALIVVMQLEQQPALVRLARPVQRARRAACIGVRTEPGAALAFLVVAHDQIARNEVDLFPVVMHEGFRGMDARREAQVASAKTALVFFVKKSCEHLLLYFRRVAGQVFPALVEVHFVELLVFFLNRHERSPNPRWPDRASRTRVPGCGS